MHVFRLGQPYPVHNNADGQEKARADLTPAFFDVCCYLDRPSPAEIAAWQGPFDYGLYQAAPGIAFILTRLASGGWLFDASLNWRIMADAGERANWAVHLAGTPVTFALIDARTNVLRGYRRFLPAPDFVARVRAVAQQQLALFADHHAVEHAIATAEQLPLAAMGQRATYYPAPA